MRAKPIFGACKHCSRDGQLWRRGLCASCYDKPGVRCQYPPMTKEEAGKLGASRAVANKAHRVASFGDREYMPVRVWAVVRFLRSAISGLLPVLIRWFPERERDKALAFARENATEFRLTVYEWVGTGDSWHEGIGRRMIQNRIAVFRKGVAA